MNSHDAIKTAVAIIWDELPALFAEYWPEVEESLLRLLPALDSAPAGDDAAANEIIEIMGKRPNARNRLVSAMGQIVGRQVKGGSAGLFDKRERFTVVPVYYATDREASGDPDPRRHYTGARGPLTFGVAEVTIPDDHRMGELKKPRWWRLEFRTDPESLALGFAFRGTATACAKHHFEDFVLRSGDHAVCLEGGRGSLSSDTRSACGNLRDTRI